MQSDGFKLYLLEDLYENELIVKDTFEENEKLESDELNLIIYQKKDQPTVQTVDISKHIILVFESTYNGRNGTNDQVYEEFDYVMDKIVYEIKVQNNGKLPLINLIGHSRGGLTNLQYALDHPDLVYSVYSAGTPYLGSTLGDVEALRKLIFEDYNSEGILDILSEGTYNGYKNRWNKYYDTLYSHIDYNVIGSKTSLAYLLELLTTDYFLHRKLDAILDDLFGDTEDISDEEQKTTRNYYRMYKFFSKIADFTNEHLDVIEEMVSVVNVYINDDIFINYSSQIGEGYQGFKVYERRFTVNNANIMKLAQKDVAIPHNLEPRDTKIINYILKTISTNTRMNGNYEYYYIDNSSVGIRKYYGNDQSSITIPAWINNKKITTIDSYAFSENNSINTINIPNTITHINNNAFEECNNLTNVNFINNSSLLELGKYAFYKCNSLTSINLPNSLQKIDVGCFMGCTSLLQITLGSNVNVIGDAAFAVSGINSITVSSYNNNFVISDATLYDANYTKVYYSRHNGELILPSTVSTISSYAFYNNDNLLSIDLKNVQEVGDYAFSYCSNLESVFTSSMNNIEQTYAMVNRDWEHVFNSNNKIGRYAFKGCDSLSNVVLYGDYKVLSEGAFENCTNLEEFIINGSLLLIDSKAFYNCEKLSDINLSNDLKWIGTYAFYNCTELSSFIVPNTVEGIYENAFENCTKLSSITLSSNLTIIESELFKNCKFLSSISFPELISEVKEGSFENCINLRKIYIHNNNEVVELSNNSFSDSSILSEIYVPIELILEYKYESDWINYKNIIYTNDEIEGIDLNCLSSIDINDISINENGTLIKFNVNCNYVYSFNVSGYDELNLALYNNLFDIINNSFISNNEYEYCINISLTEGVYYLYIDYEENIENELIVLSIDTNIEEDGYMINFNDNYDISNHLHSDGLLYKLFLKYSHLESNGLYKISLNNINKEHLIDGSIKIHSDNERTQIVKCYDLANFENDAITKDNEDCLYVSLEYNTTYYITVTLEEYQNGSFIIKPIDEVYELSIFNQSNIMSSEFINVLSLNDNLDHTSYFKKLIIKENGIFNTIVNYEGTQSTNIKVLFFEINSDGEYINLNTLTLNNTKKTINISYRELEAGAYCIGYYNLDKSKCTRLDVTYSRFVDNDSDSVYNGLLVDPNAPGMYGTQIGIDEKNATNKSYGETYITKGFTRLIFIDGSFGYQTSRTSYAWYSSDENVLSVTSYGTVLGKSEGTAKVIGVNKDNPSIIFVKEFTIIDNIDEEIHIIEINQTYSLSSNNELILNLNSSNCPYPYIQYYEFEIIECAGDTYLNAFGRIITNTSGEIVVEGVYTLNRNYIVRLIINVT